MTREEILKLEPSPELDRLVAERVMEWQESSDFAIEKETGDLLKIDLSDSIFKGLWKWSPSTDIAAAWEVVNKLLSRYNISIYSGRYPIRWFVQMVAVEDWETKALVEDENLPLAICRAALLAVMEADNGEKGGG